MKISHLKNVHFIGVGGAGVSGLARIALQSAIQVSGSDSVESSITQSLSELGATVHIGHHRDHVPHDCSLVVASAAVQPTNPEHREATRRGIRVMKYAEALGEFTRNHTNICVAGTHGKTTTTAMLAKVMSDTNKRAGYLVGGEPVGLGGSARAPEGVHFVSEACEYDRSFLKLHPSIIVLNNIEADHMDIYGDMATLTNTFLEFVNLLPSRGTLVYNADDERCRHVAKRAKCLTSGFGVHKDAEWKLEHLDDSTGFARADVTCRGMKVGELRLETPGLVNAYNALGALIAANRAGVPVKSALSALRQFAGVKRRFELLGSIGGVPIVDDYAHHPTAVHQLLDTARKTFVGRRVVAVFQGHQYQRINGFFDEFAEALTLADRVLIARTYAARESDVIPGEPEERLAKALRTMGSDAMAYNSFAGIVNDLSIKMTTRDVVLFIGAGDINHAAKDLFEARKDISTRLRAVRGDRLPVVEGAA